jgi:hypothetical protein
MRAAVLGICGALVACSPAVGSDELRIATHAVASYNWTASSCRSAGGLFGHECVDEGITIDRFDVDDTAIVDVAEVANTSVQLQTQEPGSTLVILVGPDDDVMHLDVEVVAPTVRLGSPYGDDAHLVLRGATTRVRYDLVDTGGTTLRGISPVDIDARGLAGVVVEGIDGDNAVKVHVPDKVGAFELIPMERGESFVVDVVDAGDVDGVVLGPYDVSADTREIVPTVAEAPIRGGSMRYEIVAAPGSGDCSVDATGWGELDAASPFVPGETLPVWGVRMLGGPCDVLVRLPDANGGEGLETIVAWPQ